MGRLKYLALFLLCGWMFFIGLLVGRGTAPVSFDTETFQKRLGLMAKKHQAVQTLWEKPELEFYKVLKGSGRGADTLLASLDEIMPEEKDRSGTNGLENVSSQGVPIIRSRKAMTFKADRVARYKNTRSGFFENASSTEKAAKAQTEDSEIKNTAVHADFTIQIASYRALEDAAKQVAYLKSKGFAAYRSMGRIDNTVWHRVRTGAFESRRAAEKKLVKLKQQDLDGIIIKKE